MKIASVVLTHGHPELTADTVDAIETWVGNRTLVLVDHAGWSHFQNTRLGSAKIEPGFRHAFNRNVYRNSALGLKRAYQYWPDSDWFLYTEYDCLFLSDAFKAELAYADSRNAWCVGVDLRRFDFTMPLLEQLLDRGHIRYSYYFLGCLLFLSRRFLATLVECGFLDRLLDTTRDFRKSFFPGYRRWSFEEELWATAAVQLGGSLYELACWKCEDRQWHAPYLDDPCVSYASGEHPLWRGRFPVYSIRYQPDVTEQDIAAEASIAHPVKELQSPIRLAQRLRRESIGQTQLRTPSEKAVPPVAANTSGGWWESLSSLSAEPEFRSSVEVASSERLETVADLPAPAISIIMPVYNGMRFLQRAIASLQAQTCSDWELLAVDDASNDPSAEFLTTLAATDARIRVLCHPINRGPSAARNTALKVARGDLIAYLDQDDEYYPDHLARACERMGQSDVLVFRYDLVEERPDHPAVGTVVTYDPAARAHAMFEETITVSLGVVHRRVLLSRTGLFDESLGRHRHEDEDADLWRRFVRAGAKFTYVPERSGRYHVRADSLARTRPPAPPPTNKLVQTTVNTPTGQYVLWLPASDQWLVRQIFEQHEYGGINSTWLRQPPFVLDVGANAGTFALYAKLVYHLDALIHCFEPCPPTLGLLRTNLARFHGVTIHPVALGCADGEIDLLLDPKHPAAHSIKPHLVPTPAGSVRVPLRDAGSVWNELKLDEVDVLKLDAEGCEVDVLESLGNRLNRVRVVLAEYHTADDRRRIDALLPNHVLFGAQVHSLSVGVVKYVRANLIK